MGKNAAQRFQKTFTFLWLLMASLAAAGLPDQARAQTPDFAQYATLAPVAAKGQSATLLPDGRWLLVGGEERASEAVRLDAQTSQRVVLSASLPVPRAYHTATMLPDGSILILGGMGQDGTIVSSALRFQPTTQAFETLPDTGLIPRARHTATLLTDGRVLIAGGVSDRGIALPEAELWNPRTQTSEPFHASLTNPRFDHNAALLSSDPVLLWGGRDDAGLAVTAAERYDPQRESFNLLDQADLPATPQSAMPSITASLPAQGAHDVAIDSLIAVRFSKHLVVATLNTGTVTLLGSSGPVPLKAIPAEGGLLLFVTPIAPLQPASKYTLFISGARDQADAELPFSAVGFTTAALETRATPAASSASAADDGQTWQPGPDALRGDWRAKRPASPLQNLPPLQAAAGTTALAGQVLFLDGNAAAGITLAIGDKRVQADATGRFLLAGVPAGRQTLLIDGTSANTAGASYGLFEARVEITQGQTNVLPYTSWMPRIDTQHAVSLPSPTTAETVVTSPFIPGLELHIPKDTVIRDRAGKVVTEVSITPIPIDRAPFPLPTREIPVYFTVQPGGAYLQGINLASAQGARLIYPNYNKETPGTRIDFWSYDPVDKGWYVYGQGTVSKDAKQIVPDRGVAIYEFTGAMVSQPSNAPAEGPTPDPCRTGQAGDPVDCATGLFLHERTDLALADTLPIEVRRTYRPRDSRSRSFGIGANLGYDMFMVGDINPWTYQELILPDGARIRFNRISAGTSYSDAVYEHTQSPTRYHGARLEWASGGPGPWKMTLKDGTVLWFPDSMNSSNPRAATPLRLQDRYGNALDFTRDGVGNLTRIASPNGRWVDFTYDAGNRITQARDLLGRTVTYAYDATGRLISVTDPKGGVEQYTYDSEHRMLTVKKPNGNIMVTNVYDANGRVSKQTLADGGIYQFAYTLGSNGQVVQTDVTDPRGNVRRMAFDSAGYVTSRTRALGKPEQQATVYERDPVTRLLLSMTDPLGRKTAYTYDAKGNTTSVTRLAGTPQAVIERYTYEPQFSQLATITDPLGHITTLQYDAQGNAVSLTDPLGQISQLSYNTAGLVTTITDPLSQTTLLGYDGGDLVSITDPLGRSTTRFIDAAGRLLAETDPLGRLSRTDYDVLDLPVKLTDPLGGVTSLAYDANGNLLSITDPRLGKTSYSYDAKDRVATRTDPLLKVESALYDGLDNLIQFTDRKGKIATFSYDALNRRTLAEYGRGQSGRDLTAPDASVSTSFDAGDRLTQVIDTQGGTVTRSYDGLDRLIQETSAQGTVNYAFDAAGRRTGMTVAGQPEAVYAYDAADRLTQITQGSQAVSFSYDAAGRRTGLTLPGSISAAYSYDPAGQLVGIVYSQGASSLGNLSYAYDPAGQRIQMGGSLARSLLPSALDTASFDAANRLTNWAGQAQTYDANGNLLSDGVRTYTWDSRNRLVALSGGASFKYDALNRRSQKTLAGSTTGTLHDGINPVQELSGATPTANLLSGLGIDEVFTRTDSGGTRSLLADALGSTLALADSAGIQTQYTYAPYGETSQSGTASGNAFQYTGRENDGSGLYYYRARYYDAVKSRFVSEDPIGLAGGINVYAYVDGNPVSLVERLKGALLNLNIERLLTEPTDFRLGSLSVIYPTQPTTPATPRIQ